MNALRTALLDAFFELLTFRGLFYDSLIIFIRLFSKILCCVFVFSVTKKFASMVLKKPKILQF